MYIVHRSTYLDEVSVTFCPDEVGLLDPELWGLHIKLVSMKLNHCISPCLAFSGAPNTNLCISYHLVLNRAWVWNLKLRSGAVCSIEKSSRVPIRTYNFKIRFEHELFFTKKKASTYSYIFELGYSMGKKSWNTDAQWGNRLHCKAKNPLPLPNRRKFSDFFDLCLHWLSVVRVGEH